MIPYWLFILSAWITSPVRYLVNVIPGVYYPHGLWAMRFLFSNEYKFRLVFSIALLESGGVIDGRWKSVLASKYHNLYGMGVSSAKEYQDGSWNSEKTGEPIFAIYKSDYRSVYDFYDLVYHRRPVLGQAIDKIPSVEFVSVSDTNNSGYIAYVAGVFGGYHYFTSSSADYARALWARQREVDKSYKWQYYLCNLVTLLWAAFVVYWFRKCVLFFRGSGKKRVARKRQFYFPKPIKV